MWAMTQKTPNVGTHGVLSHRCETSTKVDETWKYLVRQSQAPSLFGASLPEQCDSFPDRGDLQGVFIGDFATEFLFEGHH